MDLIKCSECGKEISDRTKKCVNCGYVMKKKGSFNLKYTIVAITVIVLGIFVFSMKSKSDPFKGMDLYMSSEEVQAKLGAFDFEERRDTGRYKYVEIYYNHKLCGYKGQLEAQYGSSEKEYGMLVWRYYFKDGYTYEDEEKCIKKITGYLKRKYGEPIDGTYGFSEAVWEDSHGHKYALFLMSDGLYIERWK